jgi:hypothetical protein
MKYKYESLEDGQVIETGEPREDLDELARWVRSDAPHETADPGVVPSGATPVAGPVNTDPVTGGNPPLLSVSAGIANPADTLSTEAAAQKAAEDLGAGATGEDTDGKTAGSEDQEPTRPGLNGSTEEWLAFARHPQVAVDVPDDAGRDAIVAAYIEKFAPAGNASGKDWADYADRHGVTADEKDGRDKIRAAVIEAGWANA